MGRTIKKIHQQARVSKDPQSPVINSLSQVYVIDFQTEYKQKFSPNELFMVIGVPGSQIYSLNFRKIITKKIKIDDCIRQMEDKHIDVAAWQGLKEYRRFNKMCIYKNEDLLLMHDLTQTVKYRADLVDVIAKSFKEKYI